SSRGRSSKGNDADNYQNGQIRAIIGFDRRGAVHRMIHPVIDVAGNFRRCGQCVKEWQQRTKYGHRNEGTEFIRYGFYRGRHTALSTGAAPKIAVEATEEASPPPVPASTKLTINGVNESMLKVHTARPMPVPISAKPPVINGMNPTRCNMEPPRSDAGIAGTAMDTTSAPASSGEKPPAAWNRWVVISSTPA